MTASSPGTALETEVSPAPEVKLRALLVEDNDLDAALVLRALAQRRLRCHRRRGAG
jgi:hypothetical protein